MSVQPWTDFWRCHRCISSYEKITSLFACVSLSKLISQSYHTFCFVEISVWYYIGLLSSLITPNLDRNLIMRPLLCLNVWLMCATQLCSNMIRSMAALQGSIFSEAAVPNVDSVSCMAHHGLRIQFTVLILGKGHFCSRGSHCALCAFMHT